MSDTPRTDALASSLPETCGLSEMAHGYNLMLTLARDLERELNTRAKPEQSPSGEGVWVPVEPTPEMGLAAYAAWDAFGEGAVMGPAEVIAIYRAMLSASSQKVHVTPGS